MRQPKPIAGARALLFDRLVGPHFDADEERPVRILNRDQLRASIRRELERLLNTRNYGIPDFSSLSAQNADDLALIASIIAQTISAFEPRLSQVTVDVLPVDEKEASLWLYIDGVMAVDLFNEPVSFPVLLNSKNGAAKVHDSQ
jgi:type VI secretion system lysozyme-like protein